MTGESERNMVRAAGRPRESAVHRTDASDPSPIERYEIAHPAVPEALEGFTILHLSDTHITDARFGGRLDEELLGALEATPVDLVALTGDYMSRPGDEGVAMEALWRLARAWRARCGAVGVFGNHDSARFRHAAVRRIEGVKWLLAGSETVEVNGCEVRIVGASDPEDLLGASLARGGSGEHRHEDVSGARAGFTFGLIHQPSAIYSGATLGVPLLLAGHTHGGQMRLSKRKLHHTAGDLPGDRACGILRLGDTLCCVSRGLGEMLLPLRVNCPRQAPLYTLRRGALASVEGEGLRRVLAW